MQDLANELCNNTPARAQNNKFNEMKNNREINVLIVYLTPAQCPTLSRNLDARNIGILIEAIHTQLVNTDPNRMKILLTTIARSLPGDKNSNLSNGQRNILNNSRVNIHAANLPGASSILRPPVTQPNQSISPVSSPTSASSVKPICTTANLPTTVHTANLLQPKPSYKPPKPLFQPAIISLTLQNGNKISLSITSTHEDSLANLIAEVLSSRTDNEIKKLFSSDYEKVISFMEELATRLPKMLKGPKEESDRLLSLIMDKVSKVFTGLEVDSDNKTVSSPHAVNHPHCS